MLWEKQCHISVVIWSVWPEILLVPTQILYVPTPTRSCIKTPDYSNKPSSFPCGIVPGIVSESISSLFSLIHSFSLSVPQGSTCIPRPPPYQGLDLVVKWLAKNNRRACSPEELWALVQRGRTPRGRLHTCDTLIATISSVS